jgi:23S rRNA pseudouridine1911/1915/1917 synthase
MATPATSLGTMARQLTGDPIRCRPIAAPRAWPARSYTGRVTNSGVRDMPAGGARSLVVEAAEAGLRVDRFLANRLGVARSQVRRLLARGRVSLNGRRLAAGDKGLALPVAGQVEVAAFRVREEQRVPSETGVLLESQRLGSGLVVLAAGPGWLAVDKPAGMPVHPLDEGETGTVLGAVVARYPELQGVGEGGLRSGVVHRLDVDTSGVLLVAAAQPAWERLRAAFREHRVEKIYRAVVLDHFPATPQSRPVRHEFGLVVARHRPARVKVVSAVEARKGSGVRLVRQSVRLLEHLRGASLVELRPSTGFLHQIRATLAHLGHPVVGDIVYGGGLSSRLSACADLAGARRQLLHAARLGFEEIRAESPDPQDFCDALKRLRG